LLELRVGHLHARATVAGRFFAMMLCGLHELSSEVL
jgi:hypothetical protein